MNTGAYMIYLDINCGLIVRLVLYSAFFIGIWKPRYDGNNNRIEFLYKRWINMLAKTIIKEFIPSGE